MSKFKTVESPQLVEAANKALGTFSEMTGKEALFVLLVMAHAVIGKAWDKERDQIDVVDKFAASLKANLALNHHKGGTQ